ncbi:hypothetical protein ACIP9G_01510 [Lysinibacillus sp. NPDC093197]|uniref:hypothetical protein n=1 Tax=Lysinibacillus sp. NPDC093197 TaxID=3364132 RepID=UPI0037FD2BAE
MIGLLNIGSLVIGIIAWLLPVVGLMQSKKNDFKIWGLLSSLSLSACAISLIFQMYYQYHLVNIEDWSALMDTTGGVIFAATVLLGVTVILNILTLIVFRKRLQTAN